MSIPVAPESQGASTRPYLIRALHEWCTDNGLTPYIAVYVDGSVQVPMEYVKNQEIVLNIGFEATSGLKLGNQFIEFRARFGGSARDLIVPVDHVVAIYARENGQGMAFPMPSGGAETADRAASASDEQDGRLSTSPRGLRLATRDDDATHEALSDGAPPEDPSPPPSRPSLKRIK